MEAWSERKKTEHRSHRVVVVNLPLVGGLDVEQGLYQKRLFLDTVDLGGKEGFTFVGHLGVAIDPTHVSQSPAEFTGKGEHSLA
ncbi:MAG: hypothetical protein M3P83_03960 [Actinomycetota bacterium]|nr:hypothetical protein [Actinomycetota bacterium]